MGPTTLIIERNSPRDLKIRSVELLLDGKPIGSLSFGQTLRIQVDAGHHRLEATNRLKSASLDFEANGQESLRLKTEGIALGGLWMIMSILGTVAYRVTLQPADTEVQRP